MTKNVAAATIAALLTSASALAQTPPPRGTTPPPVEPAVQQQPSPPRQAGRLENIKLELTITDQTGPGAPMRKVVTMIVADRERGAIRSRGRVSVAPNRWENLVINVDAVPTIIRDGSAVRVQLGLEYQPQVGAAQASAKEVEAAAQAPASEANLNEQITMILEPGKPLPISQAADPATDRRITVELTATILK
jgi:hypothetical protein